MKFYQSVQELLWEDTQTDRQTFIHTDRQAVVLINLLSFSENRLKSRVMIFCSDAK
jgi:hypothetical protein